MRNIPQPKTIPFIGNLSNINANALVKSLIEIANNYNGIYQLDAIKELIIVAYSHDLVYELCDETRFDKKLHLPLEELRGIVGDGLFTAHTYEPNWGKAHRLLMPAFGTIAIQDMFPKMMDIAEQLMLKLERHDPKKPINVAEEMTKLTLDTIALCACDYRFNSFYNEKMHPFVDAMVNALVEAGKRSKRLPIQKSLMFLSNHKFEEDTQYLHAVANEIIDERKKDPHGASKKDFLSVMLNNIDTVKQEKLSEENIRQQLITFLIAGHETTSGLLSFTIYLILNNPLVLKKMQTEIQQIVGNEPLRIEHIQQLKYTEQVLKESLRLYPTASAFAVAPYQDTVIGDKYSIAENQTVVILTWMLHRDKKIWGNDVEEFNPDRFSPENWQKMPAHSWKPFGNGQRACIGMAFAMQEAILVMAILLQRFEIHLDNPAYTLDIKETLTIKPHNFYIKVSKKPISLVSKNSTNKITTPSVSRAGMAQNALVFTAPKTGKTPLLIMYGSNSGSSESFARRIATEATNKGCTVTIGEMNSFVNCLPKEGITLIITASYEGQPTHNAKLFVDWLSFIEEDYLKGVQYAVLGCGHKDWVKTYQAVPQKIDDLLYKNGAKRLMQRGELDASGDFLGDFDKWRDQFFTILAPFLDNESEEKQNENTLELKIIDKKLELLHQTDLKQSIVLENRELVNLEYPQARSKRHIEVSITEGGTYQAGDYVSVLPNNSKNVIKRVLNRFRLNEDTQIILQSKNAAFLHLPIGFPVWLTDILTHYVELSQPITKKQVYHLIDACPCPPEKKALMTLSEDEKYQEEVLIKRMSVLDLLEKYQSIDLKLAEYLEMLPPLKPRLYSISSSSLADKSRLSMTVSVVKSSAWSGNGLFEGVASNYLASLAPQSTIKINTRPSITAFHLPEDSKRPIIMVCAGSGIAPFRGFIQERAIQKAQGHAIGKALLFFGFDHPDIDFLYKKELLTWEEKGIVTIHTAHCLLPNDDIVFVQHRLWKERRTVYEYIVANAKIYVCGDGKNMAPVVRNTFKKIYTTYAQVSDDVAENWITEKQKDGVRYVADVYV